MAKRYHGQAPFGDLVAAGNEGFLRAVGRYDPDSGTHFLTYARHWVRQRLLAHIVRIGASGSFAAVRARKVIRVWAELEKEAGEPPAV